jgi:CubicO group peptidase (beta-lactamase class C family)
MEAEDVDFQKQLRSHLEPLRAKQGYPALVVGVLVRNKARAAVAVGVRKQDSPAPILVSDAMHLGSNSKSMTAMVLAMLVEGGKLRWDSTIAELFPEMSKTTRTAYQSVRLVDLLWQISGLKGSVPNGDDLAYWHRHTAPIVEQRRECVEALLKETPDSTPRTKYTYANANYVIAGAIAERVTGAAWEDLVRHKLFKPLGMSSGGFGAMGKPNGVDQAWQHQTRDGKLVPMFADNPPVLGPAGRAHCSVIDWLKYANVYLRTTDGIVSAASLRNLQTPSPVHSGYALGWGVGAADAQGLRELSHRGSNTLSDSKIRISPARGVVVAAMVNQVATDAFYDELWKVLDGAVQERYGV